MMCWETRGLVAMLALLVITGAQAAPSEPQTYATPEEAANSLYG